MSNTIGLQPMQTSVAAGLFSIQTEGYVVGDYLPDPATRNALAGGYLAATETLPMWGGVAISEKVSGDGQTLGGAIGRAADDAHLIGFSVNTNSWISTPSSELPLAVANMQVNFFRIGSRQRVVVAIDPALVGTVTTGLTNQDFEWDYTNQKLIAGTGLKALGVRVLSVSTNCKVPVFNSSTGNASWAIGAAAVIEL